MPSFLLEVGTEELPATFVEGAIAQWEAMIPASLKEQYLTCESVKVYATPRRLAVVIAGLPEQQPDRQEEIKGPPATAAFKEGKPTKAAEGFAKKQNIKLEDIEIRPTPKGDFVFVLKHIPGRKTAEIVTELIRQWINRLEGKRFMRWGDGDIRFPRPIRWLVTLLDKEILPLSIPNGSETISSDRHSQGHRVLHPNSVSIAEATEYAETLGKAFVEVDPQTRKTAIANQVKVAANSVGGEAEIPEDLLNEVVNLVEWPTAVVGTFDGEFLVLPPEVIKMVMVTHQRYFPVLDTQGNLKPYFITISNGDPAKAAIIASGNERVIRARLADGEFFYKTDLKKPLENYLPDLENVTFQEDLGSVRDKVNRIIANADRIAKQLKVSEGELAQIKRAALLCKADLVSQMVYEFPELEGIMGEKYALAGGESEGVAKAIVEHYLPKGASDRLPTNIISQVVALADKLDTLVSIFGLGMLPTGSSDPFALRRAANGVLNIIWSADLPLNLHELLKDLTTDFVNSHPNAMLGLIHHLEDFFLQRIRTLLQDEKSIDYDLVNAVLGDEDIEYKERALQDLLDVRDRALFLQEIRGDGTLDIIYETINRSTRLAKQGDLDTGELQPDTVINPSLFEKSSEQALMEALENLIPNTQAALETRNYRQLVTALAAIVPTVTQFFDGENSVLVMDSNPKVQRNRLNLLGLLRNHARVLADFGAIVKG
ncbi:glycine--tRNA ligase subunit beta [Arthrospira platensis]|uniref:Glycine--tRNA ligase beta subunit n=1 Tax=Limnospira platensis NIES-46 TaxID=1236695 RepID=A0A5M3T7P7_LIMPL|nr:glycine--tRNA ligase subunit beta [Arthrospira platensis]AMW31040.1 glycine--tRNA ligase subunit beta [Arthrospira platensis YZ]KDR54820.1 glycyl-tRNA synthetase subunit beta [Arthrospira platensis str. Paraca]MBD2670467.1 glycine--tRNA ligase subunit beta [Arthrospira platensis FACHB-439]MBD2711213.1 glycine--tRNA ligase subunit beta [Arthrospira platensis FACHB-835]MDF2208432.1 glycine--tRNA ligase subunit beta [Arthrospira platensis NCB002]MDT9182871.1 glycine--tRNA ligase subunit beta 